MELNRFRVLGVVALVTLVGTITLYWTRSRDDVQRPLPIPGEGQRIQVEVLNATSIDGLARATTRRLRRAGIDVVYYGTSTDTALDSTLILVRRGDSSFVGRIREVLATGRVVLEPDLKLLLDASVILGRDLVPPRPDH